MSGKKKIRVDLRKNRTKPPRDKTWTRGFQEHSFTDEAPKFEERVRAKGDLSRRRTITQRDDAGTPMPGVDSTVAISGRVLRIHGLHSIVEAADGTLYRCAVSGLLKSLVTEERSVVATGDNVWLRRSPVSGPTADEPEGLIERVEPRHGVLTRESRGREHVLVANVDQIVIVVSISQPDLKPHLIDRYVANARLGDLKPVICLNKVDLVSAELLQPMVGAYSQLGIPTLLTSAASGVGIEALREHLRDRTSVFSGQSGVGKSSLLNAIQPGLELAGPNRKRHDTKRNAHNNYGPAFAAPNRRLGGGHPRDTPVQTLECPVRGSRGTICGVRPICGWVQFPRLHAHARDSLPGAEGCSAQDDQ